MNRKQKRSFPVLIMPVLLLMLVFGLLSGCGSSPQETKPQETKAQETKAHETGQQGAGQTKEAQQGTGQTKPGQPGTKPEQSETKPQETAEASAVGSMKDIPHYEERYYLKRLDPALLEDFLQMYRGILDFKEVIELPDRISSENVELLLNVIQYDCPELFQAAYSGSYTMTMEKDSVFEVRLNYLMGRGEYETALRECNAAVREIVEGGRSLSGDEEKERYVYDLLTDRITYDKTGKYCGTAYGALVENAAKCDGISLAMKWVMEEMGIQTLVISGQEAGDPYGHAWNCVFINHTYHDLDLTNDLRSEDRGMKLYGAFNVSRGWLTRTYPLSEVLKRFTLPQSVGMGSSYHARNGTYIRESGNIWYKVHDLLEAADREEQKSGLIQFEREEEYQEFMNNYGTHFKEWFVEHHYSGEYRIVTLNEFRTIGFILEIR